MGKVRSQRKAARFEARVTVVCLGPNDEVWHDSVEHVQSLIRSGDAHKLDASKCQDLTGPQRAEIAAAPLVVYVSSGMPSGFRGRSCSAGADYTESLPFDREARADMPMLRTIQMGMLASLGATLTQRAA